METTSEGRDVQLDKRTGRIVGDKSVREGGKGKGAY